MEAAKQPRWTHTVAAQPTMHAVAKLRVQAFVKSGLLDNQKEFDARIEVLTDDAAGYEAYASQVKSASGRFEQIKHAQLNREIVRQLRELRDVANDLKFELDPNHGLTDEYILNKPFKKA